MVGAERAGLGRSALVVSTGTVLAEDCFRALLGRRRGLPARLRLVQDETEEERRLARLMSEMLSVPLDGYEDRLAALSSEDQGHVLEWLRRETEGYDGLMRSSGARSPLPAAIVAPATHGARPLSWA